MSRGKNKPKNISKQPMNYRFCKFHSLKYKISGWEMELFRGSVCIGSVYKHLSTAGYVFAGGETALTSKTLRFLYKITECNDEEFRLLRRHWQSLSKRKHKDVRLIWKNV